jgi:thioredoxin
MKKTLFRALLLTGITVVSYSMYACTGLSNSETEEGVVLKNAEKDSMSITKFDKLIAGDKLVMVDFYAIWCGPCKRMAPFVEQVKEEKKKDVTVLSIDAEEQADISSRYRLEGYPTLIFFKKGQVVANAIGYHTKEQMIELIEKFK